MWKLLSVAVCLPLASPAYSEVSNPDGGKPSEFNIGQWRGKCFRDGYLQGSRTENCSATLTHASIEVILARRALGMMVLVNFQRCPNGIYRKSIDQKALASKNRDKELQRAIKDLAALEKRPCGQVADFSTRIVRSELADVLKETDGLSY
jgi:hypothetical protein